MPRRHNRRSAILRVIRHVMARGDDRQPIVTRQSERLAFVTHLGAVAAANDLIIHAWCLMDNHYHIILETPLGSLASALLHLGRWNAEVVPWRFKSIPVDVSSYLVALSRYLHRNPVRACMTKDPATHPWSSYRAYVGLAMPPTWLHTSTILGMFGDDVAAARKSYHSFVEDKPSGLFDIELQRLLRVDENGTAEKGTDPIFRQENKSVPFSLARALPATQFK